MEDFSQILIQFDLFLINYTNTKLYLDLRCYKAFVDMNFPYCTASHNNFITHSRYLQLIINR